MKKIVYAILATVSGLVLLFSYRTSLPEHEAAAAATIGASRPATPRPVPTTTSAPAPNSGGSTNAQAATPAPSTGGAAAPSTASTGLADGTYTGSAANTRYGAVQVQITVAGGVITDVQVPQYPSSNGRDQQINQYALPQLVSETLAAQSSKVDMVSGATYTSNGYIASLQSAIDRASA